MWHLMFEMTCLTWLTPGEQIVKYAPKILCRNWRYCTAWYALPPVLSPREQYIASRHTVQFDVSCIVQRRFLLFVRICVYMCVYIYIYIWKRSYEYIRINFEYGFLVFWLIWFDMVWYDTYLSSAGIKYVWVLKAVISSTCSNMRQVMYEEMQDRVSGFGLQFLQVYCYALCVCVCACVRARTYVCVARPGVMLTGSGLKYLSIHILCTLFFCRLTRTTAAFRVV
jgi:hypothetical protein